jgi:mono/diheme cytochrome c family protein
MIGRIVGVVGFVFVAAGCNRPAPGPDRASGGRSDREAQEAAAPPALSAVQRGEYLAAAGACSECHTPMRMGPNGPEPDVSRFMSGHPESEIVDPAPARTEHSTTWMWSQSNTVFIGDFGTSFAINLTPDEATGIGAWTEDIFVKTLKTGRHWGAARPILPPMPWQAYSQMTDDDLKAMYAYLRSIPAIKNRVPEAVPAPPSPGA